MGSSLKSIKALDYFLLFKKERGKGMKRVGSILVALMLLFNVSFGYVLTVTYNGNQAVSDIAGGETVVVGLSCR